MQKRRFNELVELHHLWRLPIRFGIDNISILVIYERLLRRSISVEEQVYVVWDGQEKVCELTETYDTFVDDSALLGQAPGSHSGIRAGVPLFKALLDRRLEPYAIVVRDQFPLYRGPRGRHVLGDYKSHFAVHRCQTKRSPWYPIAKSLERSCYPPVI